ncbi:hypothetical protein BJY01DRAFT_255296 [Aspergillus pseudoustus]|uniref:Rhodopsin domain-containing protein n=1 Tax=Aspergillus pseudoustus TaxID=1810923 RepID=A0ABR4ILE8_9EURO
MDESGVVIFYLSIVALVLTWVTVSLRFYVRLVLKPSFGLDDCLLIVSLILASGHFIVSVYEPKCKIREDLNSLTPDETESNLKCFFASQLLWVTATATIKISFALTLRRFLVIKWQHWCIWSSVSTTLIITIFYFCWLVFGCHPIRYFWQRAKQPFAGSCKPMSTLAAAAYAHASVLLVNDIFLAVLPVFIVKDIQMNRSAKAAVVSILSIGSIPAVATIIRITHVPVATQSENFIVSTAGLAIWSIVEISTSIMAVAATALRPLAEKLVVLKWRAPSSGNATVHSNGMYGDVRLHDLDSSRMTSTDRIVISYQKHSSFD